MNTMEERHAAARPGSGEKPGPKGEHASPSTSTTPPPPPPGHHNAPARAEKHAEPDHDELPKDLRKPHAITVVAVGLLFVALLGGLFFVGYVPHKQAEKQAEADAEAVSDETALVAVAQPRPAEAAKAIELPCDIRPNQETLIYPRASGYLKKLYVDIQDHVKEGQLLAEIDAPEVDAQLVQAQAALQQSHADKQKADADLQLAERTYARYENAVKNGQDVSKQEMDERSTQRDQAKAAVAQATAAIGSAEANVQRLKVMQGFEKVTAPFAGVITARNYDVGALLAPGTGREMFRLQQSDMLKVYVSVPQSYATDIRTGQEATLQVRNFPKRTFTGTVARQSEAINANTRTMLFELHFPNKDEALVPGMYGQAKLAVESPPKALLVPVSAMLFNAGGTQVATVEEGKVHFQKVVVGRDLGTELEVLDGLNADAQVITNPGERLKEGSAVQVAAVPAKGQVAASKER